MPVIAVGVAIGADIAAGAAVAGTVGGFAAISATTAFEVVAAVGATIGAIGVVARDKTLSTVGLAIGAVGGVGALASSAGLFGAEAASGAPLFGAAPATSTADAGAAATFADSLTPATAGTADGAIDAGTWGTAANEAAGTDAAFQNTVNFVAGGDQPSPTDLTTLSSTSENAADPAAKLAAGNAGGPATATDQSAGLINSPTASTDTSASTLGAASEDQGFSEGLTPATAGTPNGPIDSGAFSPAQGSSGSSSIIDDIVDYAGKHPVVALGALQAGGSLLSGLTSTLTPAQVAAANAQAAYNQSQANLTAQQAANLAAPKAVASLAPVTGVPTPLIGATSPAGLINRAPLAPVTGVPA